MRTVLTSSLWSQSQLFNHLTSRLLNPKQWQLMESTASACLVRETGTGRVYEIVRMGGEQGNSEQKLERGNQTQREERDQLCEQNNEDSGIFMNLYRIGQGYYLSEKSVGCLAQRIFLCRLRGNDVGFSQQEIINTFMPILRAITRNVLPSSFQILSSNILIDSNQNIRLRHTPHPNLPHNLSHNHPHNPSSNPHCRQLASVILQTSLLLSHENCTSLLKNQDKIVHLLVQKKYTCRIIALLVILLKEGMLEVGVRDWMEGNLGAWYEELRRYVRRLRDNSKDRENANCEISALNRTVVKGRLSATGRYDDETEDSQNQILAKYRSGKRITNYRVNQINCEDSQVEEQMLKPRKDRVRPQNFNY